MTNSYFDNPETKPDHPRIRAWKSYKALPRYKQMHVQVTREREAFGFGPATLYIDFVDGSDDILRQDSIPWDVVLDDWLVSEHARARDDANEILRTSLRLRNRVEPLLRDCGEGYFNALLVHVVKHGPLVREPPVRDLLTKLTEYPPYDGGKLQAYARQLEDIFRGMAHELMVSLKYSRSNAESIFARAVAMYLDERFHISDRIALFGR